MINYEQVAIWSQVISSGLFLVVMIWIWIKWIQPAVLAAQANNNKQIAEAERHRDEAKAALEALRLETNGANRDAQLIRDRANSQGKHETEATIAEAKQAGERALRNAAGELERARAAAREQLREELLDKALASARIEAAKRVDGTVNANLVNRFVSSLTPEADRG